MGELTCFNNNSWSHWAINAKVECHYSMVKCFIFSQFTTHWSQQITGSLWDKSCGKWRVVLLRVQVVIFGLYSPFRDGSHTASRMCVHSPLKDGSDTEPHKNDCVCSVLPIFSYCHPRCPAMAKPVSHIDFYSHFAITGQRTQITVCAASFLYSRPRCPAMGLGVAADCRGDVGYT